MNYHNFCFSYFLNFKFHISSSFLLFCRMLKNKINFRFNTIVLLCIILDYKILLLLFYVYSIFWFILFDVVFYFSIFEFWRGLQHIASKITTATTTTTTIKTMEKTTNSWIEEMLKFERRRHQKSCESLPTDGNRLLKKKCFEIFYSRLSNEK